MHTNGATMCHVKPHFTSSPSSGSRNRQRKSMVRVTRDRPSGARASRGCGLLGLLGLRTSGTLGVSNLDTKPSWVSQNYSKSWEDLCKSHVSSCANKKHLFWGNPPGQITVTMLTSIYPLMFTITTMLWIAVWISGGDRN